MNRLGGCKVVITGQQELTLEIPRKWYERLFSLTPFVKSTTSKYMVEILADGDVVRNGDNLYMNQATLDDFDKARDGIQERDYANH